MAGLTFYGMHNMVGLTVAASICGLDCGDYEVEEDGSITVPYQSDPDGLFTAAYVIDIADNPPDQIATYGWGVQGVVVEISGTQYTIPVAIGASYTSQGKLLRPDVQDRGQNGPGLGKTRRLHMFAANLVSSLGVSFGTDFTTMFEATPPGNGQADNDMATLFSGVYWNTISSNYDFDGQLCWQVTRPYPCTLTAVTSFLRMEDR